MRYWGHFDVSVSYNKFMYGSKNETTVSLYCYSNEMRISPSFHSHDVDHSLTRFVCE